MNVQRPAVVEHEQLVLGALLDGDDDVNEKRRQRASGDAPGERGVQQPGAGNGPADDGATDSPRSALDFRELRHRCVESGLRRSD
jgi:hypothetical protein